MVKEISFWGDDDGKEIAKSAGKAIVAVASLAVVGVVLGVVGSIWNNN